MQTLITVEIIVHRDEKPQTFSFVRRPDDVLLTLLFEIAARLEITYDGTWTTRYQGTIVSPEMTLSEIEPSSGEVVLELDLRSMQDDTASSAPRRQEREPSESDPPKSPPPPPLLRSMRARRHSLPSKESEVLLEYEAAELDYDMEADEETDKRRATVRYYHRMNPQRLYPMLIVLSKDKIKEVQKKAVSQTTSEQFEVQEDKPVEVEPILPGCDCYPVKQSVPVGEDVTLTFWVVPQVVGAIQDSRVVVRQEDQVLTEIPLKMRVSVQTLAKLMGALTFFLPFLSSIMRHYEVDFDSQLNQGFSLYAHVGNFLVSSLTPEVIGATLLVLTVGLYLWHRPRKREVFWDVEPEKST